MSLIILMVAVALVEAASVVSILPFIAVLANPGALSGDGTLSRIYSITGLNSVISFYMLLGTFVLMAVLISSSLKAYLTWRMNSFIQTLIHKLSVRLLKKYLSQPYSTFLRRHSAELTKNVLGEVSQVVNGVIQPAMLVIARAAVAISLFILLMLADAVIAVIVAVAFGGAYVLVYALARNYTFRIGRARFDANRARFHSVSESFSGVKEIKLRGLEATAVSRFEVFSESFSRYQAANATLATVPRYALEVIAFGGVLTLVLYLLSSRGGLGEALPLIALFAFAGYRMLPTLQDIYSNMTKMRFAAPALALLHRDLAEKSAAAGSIAPPSAPLAFNRELRFEGVTFAYAGADGPALRDVDLVVSQGARVGISGPTGSGKSTLVDLLLGLLAPTSGRILVDGEPLDTAERVRAWQANIGYVPQTIFIADDTIAANIAFGRRPEEIDRAAVERAARAAQLHDFIVSELPGGYDATVGERGVRLSGGQRQRLGLARALYDDPAVLVLDEATSALDEATEDAVMEAIDALGKERTVIMIAHRLRTLEGCRLRVHIVHGVVDRIEAD